MLRIETEREEDGRWLAEVLGVLVSGATEADARSRGVALVLRTIAEGVESGEALPPEFAGLFEAA